MLVIIALLGLLGAALIAAGLQNKPLPDLLRSWVGQA